ncbi:unnamed protein product [Adineta steineri]|uniref:Uncharacterized protein n=1 Tax=Adineta steineri TaxID=433720 RepID=A0A814ZTV8_9BILA|nr:unnamed protein product [Adineta steineri]CAF3696668.1 unnamed protein product [Adineta steineri]
MEYRFFYPITEHQYNTKWKTKSFIESRTDIYFILTPLSDNFHIEHGLKLRNRKKLELKVREQRFENGQEYWVKKIHSHRRIDIDDMKSITKYLTKSNENQLIDRLNTSKPLILCYVNKIREQTHIGSGITQELTGLHLQFIQAEDQSQIGHDLFFETACIEQSTSKLIDENIIERLCYKYGDMSINPMGYPEFLYQQYRRAFPV